MAKEAEAAAVAEGSGVGVGLEKLIASNVMKVRVLVLFAVPWEFTDEKTGEILRGTSIHYCQPSAQADNGRGRGWRPQKCTCEYEAYNYLGPVPAFFEATAVITDKGAKLGDFRRIANLEAQ